MKTAALALAAMIAAGPVQAQTAPDVLMAAPLRTTPKGLVLDLATAAPAAYTPRYAGAREPRIPGVARTSVDRRFEDEGVVGSLGFLCGLEPGAERQAGGAATRGYDPSGRFVGAKLRVAFR